MSHYDAQRHFYKSYHILQDSKKTCFFCTIRADIPTIFSVRFCWWRRRTSLFRRLAPRISTTHGNARRLAQETRRGTLLRRPDDQTTKRDGRRRPLRFFASRSVGGLTLISTLEGAGERKGTRAATPLSGFGVLLAQVLVLVMAPGRAKDRQTSAIGTRAVETGREERRLGGERVRLKPRRASREGQFQMWPGWHDPEREDREREPNARFPSGA